MNTDIEPGMTVVCVDDKWHTRARRPLPQVGSRWFVLDVVVINTDTHWGPYLVLARWPEDRAFHARHFRPIDGEFERLEKLADETVDLESVEPVMVE